MCGRLNISDEPLGQWVAALFGIPFRPLAGNDVRPTQSLACLVSTANGVEQQEIPWGVKPAWAKNVLINAQAETVADKPTFRDAFVQHRCLVPCSGWYEWRAEGERRKRRYTFFPASGEPGFLMAGIVVTHKVPVPGVVTLTTAANPECEAYHHRMPLLVGPDTAHTWLAGEIDALGGLMLPVAPASVKVVPWQAEPARNDEPGSEPLF